MLLKHSLKRIYILPLILLATLNSYGQFKGKLFSSYYSPKDYSGSTQNWAIAQDSLGLMYFANNNGIMVYDGSFWQTIEIPNKSTVRAMAKTPEGNIIAGVVKDMGHIEIDQKGRHYFKSVKYLIDSAYSDFSDVWSVQSTSQGDFYLTDNYFFRFKNDQVKIWEKRGKYFFLCFNVDNEVYMHEVGIGLQKVKGDSLNLLPYGDFFAEKRVYNVLKFDEQLFVFTRFDGIFCLNENKKELIRFGGNSLKAQAINNFLKENVIYSAIKPNDTSMVVSTLKKGAILFSKEGEIIDVFNEESVNLKSRILSMHNTSDGILWLALNNGILKVEIGTPFRYWDKDLGLYGTVSTINMLDEQMYVGTGMGLYKMENTTLENYLEVNKIEAFPSVHNQIWDLKVFLPKENDSNLKKPHIDENTLITKLPVEDTVLIVSSTTYLKLLKNNELDTLFPVKTGFLTYQDPLEPNRIYIGLSQGVATVDYYKGKWYYNDFIKNSAARITSITKDENGDLWFFLNYKGLLKLNHEYLDTTLEFDASSDIYQLYDTSHGLPNIHSIIIGNINGKLKVHTLEGIYTPNDDETKFIPDTTVGRNYIDSTWEGELNVDYYKNIWINSNDKRFKGEDGNFYSDTITFRRIYDYLLGVVSSLDSFNLWIGSPDGLFYYNHTMQKDYRNSYRTLIRKVHLYDDSLIYGGAAKQSFNTDDSAINLHTIIPHRKNSISFTYSAPYFIGESKTLYSCFLEGYDDDWSPWNKEKKKRYTNLREGKYLFKVKAKNLYGIESTIASFKFEILPPWYRTVWAFLAYLIMSLFLVIIIVHLYTKRLLHEKEKLENTVQERTQEILMQKEEIFAQAESLRDANESIMAQNKALENQKQELELQKDQLSKRTWQLRRLNHELMKLSTVASETDNAIAIFDSEGNIQWVNDGFTRLYGYNLQQFKQERNENIMKASDNPNISEAIKRCLREQKSVIYEYNAKTRQGDDIWVQTTLTNVIDKKGKTINLIAIDSDITKIKNAEEEILRQKREIEDQRDQLAKSDATKNKFFRIIAHDLRNPISTLAAATSTILQLLDEFDKDKTREFVIELNKMAQTTFVLLENLLDWSTSQMKEIPYNPRQLDLLYLVEDSMNLVSAKVQSKEIKLEINVPEQTYVFADENMVKTVIRNLLSNAVKFTSNQGSIEVTATEAQGFIKLEVKDSGVGIKEKDQSKLFRIDVHHSTLGTSNEKGSGLGLILCKEFIEKNGGEIWVKSEPGKGSAFAFTLKKMKAEFNA